MQGNSEAREKFAPKKKDRTDSNKKNVNKADRAWRKKRQDRHNQE